MNHQMLQPYICTQPKFQSKHCNPNSFKFQECKLLPAQPGGQNTAIGSTPLLISWCLSGYSTLGHMIQETGPFLGVISGGCLGGDFEESCRRNDCIQNGLDHYHIKQNRQLGVTDYGQRWIQQFTDYLYIGYNFYNFCTNKIPNYC